MTAQHIRTGPVELPDGSVIVPPDVAGELVAAAVRDLTARARRDGLAVSPRALAVLQALHEAAVRHDDAAAGFATETTEMPSPIVEISTDDAAALLGCTAQRVRTLCRSGRILARRAGQRTWLVDQASLDAYRFGRTP